MLWRNRFTPPSSMCGEVYGKGGLRNEIWTLPGYTVRGFGVQKTIAISQSRRANKTSLRSANNVVLCSGTPVCFGREAGVVFRKSLLCGPGPVQSSERGEREREREKRGTHTDGERERQREI